MGWEKSWENPTLNQNSNFKQSKQDRKVMSQGFEHLWMFSVSVKGTSSWFPSQRVVGWGRAAPVETLHHGGSHLREIPEIEFHKSFLKKINISKRLSKHSQTPTSLLAVQARTRKSPGLKILSPIGSGLSPSGWDSQPHSWQAESSQTGPN